MALAAYHAYISQLDASGKTISDWMQAVGVDAKNKRHRWSRKRLLDFQKKVRRSQGESI